MKENVPIYLITRYLSLEATEEEKQELERWKNQSPSHQKIFDEHKTLWERVRVHEQFNLQRGLERINSRIDSYESEQTSVRKISGSNFYIYKIAASFLVVAVASVILFLVLTKNQVEQNLTWHKLQTEAGKQDRIVLADSSHIHLNSQSVLSYPASFANHVREVQLTGEAYFQITKDVARPFIIRTGNLTTYVVGTAFNIKSDSNSVIVSVASGIVKVFVDQDTILLRPGEEVMYVQGANIIAKTNTDLEQVLAWMTKSIYAEDETLAVVAEKIYELYGATSEFDNDKIRKCRITAKFRSMPLKDILQAIEFSTGAHYHIVGNHIVWSGAGCSTVVQ